jgi:hypothetical protein
MIYEVGTSVTSVTILIVNDLSSNKSVTGCCKQLNTSALSRNVRYWEPWKKLLQHLGMFDVQIPSPAVEF